MNPDARCDVHFHRYRHGIDSDALCAMNVYQHDFFALNVTNAGESDDKKKKNVAKIDYKINFSVLKFIL